MPVTGAQLLAAALEADHTTGFRASTSCTSIDEVLGGGFEYGKITSLAGDTATGKTTIAMHTIARHIVASRESTAAIVDTSGAFSLTSLRDIITHHLNCTTHSSEDTRISLEGCLARIEIMRCFDFAGLVEAVEEAGARYADMDAETDSPHLGRQVLIVDNITSVLDQDQINEDPEIASLFSSFQQSLRRMTVRNQVCCLLINTVASRENAPRGTSEHAATRGSAFLSIKQTPALGNAYAHMIDLSVLLFRLPKSREDAEARYAPDPGRLHQWGIATILEILLDRGGSRDGQWAAFEVAGIELLAMDQAESSA